MDERSFLEMRKGLEIQMRHKLYKDSAFRFWHSLGIFNFLQGFRSDIDDVDFGVLHIYWDRNGQDNILYPDGTPQLPGIWRHKWYDAPIDPTTIPLVKHLHEDIISEGGKQKMIEAVIEAQRKVIENAVRKQNPRAVVTVVKEKEPILN